MMKQRHSTDIYPVPPGAKTPPRATTSDAELSLNRWGYEDTQFRVDASGLVTLTGDRYSLCGQYFDRLIPYAEQKFETVLTPHAPHAFSYPMPQPPSRVTADQLNFLTGLFGESQVTVSEPIRLRHGHGHSQEDIWSINYDRLERIPDIVVYPSTEAEISQLVSHADDQSYCLIPFGGGTNVTNAVRCPKDETRTIVSVDMRRMSAIKWIDSVNRLACIESGATGKEINDTLAQYGFTLGHEPDSYELSTLGGWIATYASGMKKNRYGNIEEIVQDFRVVSPGGNLTRSNTAARESIGFDYRKLVFGSEGRLGIVTQVLVKLSPLPQVQKHQSIVFRDFETGVEFLRTLKDSGTLPASIRLMENKQFILGQCLKPSPTGLKALASDLQKRYLTWVKGFDLDAMAACTVLYEGSGSEVVEQKRRVDQQAKRFGGVSGGEKNGQQGYALTFAIAYLRDFLMTQWIIAESFETTVAWSDVVPMCERVENAIIRKAGQLGIQHKPFLTYRLTQAYQSSACIYFYLGIYYKGLDAPSDLFSQLEHVARKEILDCGGSLSHHHGIGKLRQSYLQDIESPLSLSLKDSVKDILDPNNCFAVGNQ